MRIAIVDDLAAETCTAERPAGAAASPEKCAGGYSGIRKRRDISGSGKESALYCRISGYLYGWHDGHGGGKRAAQNRYGLSAGFYHDLHRSCAGGFQVRALHYLVKPFTEADIDVLTDELLARIPQPDKYMELKVEGSEIHLRYQDIVYAEHFAHLIYVHTTVQKTLATRQPFKSFISPTKG